MPVRDRGEVGFGPEAIARWIGLQAIEGAPEKRDRLIHPVSFSPALLSRCSAALLARCSQILLLLME